MSTHCRNPVPSLQPDESMLRHAQIATTQQYTSPPWITGGERTATPYGSCCPFVNRGAALDWRKRLESLKRALKSTRFDGWGMDWNSRKWLRGYNSNLRPLGYEFSNVGTERQR
jgi:hypothetical protein